MSTNDTVQYILIVVLIALLAFQQQRVSKVEAGIRWFATHIKIDDRDLEKDPPPDDLQAIIDSFDGHDEL